MIPIRLAIVGDTQRVLPIEQLAFGRETNDTGRRKIAKGILGERLDALLHLGDLIGSASDWSRFDQDYPPSELSSKHIRVCRGNHDCGGLWFGSPAEFNRRFPEAVAKLQMVELGFLRIILLDTNQDAMSTGQWATQLSAFGAALADATRDSQVKHVLVAGHHPPFTNGRWHEPSLAVLKSFVKPHLKCPKARAFFAGHVHGYERFTIGRRSFVVTGGGGGARFAHLQGEQRRQSAALELPDPHPLHYVLLEVVPSSIQCTVKAVNERSGAWFTLDSWTM